MEGLLEGEKFLGWPLVLLPRIMGNFCVRVFSARMPHPDINLHCTAIGKPVGRLFVSN